MLRFPRNRRYLVLPAAALWVGVVGLFLGDVAATTDEAANPAGGERLRESVRDSLRLQIMHYSEMIGALRDSLADQENMALDDRWIGDVEAAIASLGETIGSFADQLSALQIEIDAGRFSLRDGQGGRVSVDFPRDLGERISQGIASISRVILDEIPDTLRADDGHTSYFRSWNGRIPGLTPPVSRPQNTIRGDIFKFNDDLVIAASDVVEGDVVAILSSVVIEGRVQGDLVVVLGDVQLREGAFVDGAVVHVLGRFDRHEAVRTGGTTVRIADLGEGLLLLGRDRQAATWASFWAWQAMFVLVVCLVLLLVAVLPSRRLEGVATVLRERTAASLGLGLLLVGVGHVLVIGLSALLVMTVIGIPIALLVLLALAVVDLAAVGVACQGIGRRICAGLGLECRGRWLSVLLGLLILHAPAFLAALGGLAGLPSALLMLLVWFGRTCKLLALAAGLGAMILGRLGTNARSERVVQVHELASG